MVARAPARCALLLAALALLGRSPWLLLPLALLLVTALLLSGRSRP